MHPHHTQAVIDRFLSYVEKSPDPDGCWLWTGTPSQRYGQFRIDGKALSAHRFAYELFVAPITDGLWVLHRCDVMRCVNPAHLFLGTAAANAADMLVKGRNSHGDQHWARTRPERLARGLRNGSYTKPERRPRGERNGSRLHPEHLQHGERNVNAKLNARQAAEIRERYRRGGILQRELAAEFGVDQTSVSHIVQGKIWRDALD